MANRIKTDYDELIIKHQLINTTENSTQIEEDL
jgi:hypothetical protein